MKLCQIDEFKVGKSVQGFYLCKEKQVRNTRNGDLYLDLLLVDGSGSVHAKLWDHVDTFMNRFIKGDAVAVKGIPTEYHNEIQLTITQINKATNEKYNKYGFNPLLLIPSSEIPPEKLWKELQSIIKKITDSNVQNLLKIIFDKHREIISILPASVHHHHPVRGGFLEHIVSTGSIAVKLKNQYKDVNNDLVIAGVLLHDIGKINGMTGELESDYTLDGHLIGHTVLGWEIVKNAISEIKEFDDVLAKKLEHIIIAHQGKQTDGAPRIPKFPEALLVHYIDEIDGKIDLMIRTIKEDNNLEEWTDKRNIFRTQIWKK